MVNNDSNIDYGENCPKYLSPIDFQWDTGGTEHFTLHLFLSRLYIHLYVPALSWAFKEIVKDTNCN